MKKKLQDNKVAFLILQWLKKHIVLVSMGCTTIIFMALIKSILYTKSLSSIIQALFQKDGSKLKAALIYFIIIIIIKLIISSAQNVIHFKVEKNLIFYLENYLYKFYNKLKCWQVSISDGDVQAIFSQSIKKCCTETLNFMELCLSILILIISSSIYAFYINPTILFVCIVVVCIMLLFSKKSFKDITSYRSQLNDSDNMLYQYEWEYVTNKEICMFLDDKKLYHNYEKETDNYISTMLSLRKIQKRFEVLSILCNMMMILIVVFVGSLLSIRGNMTLDAIYSLVIIMPTVSNAFFNIPNIIIKHKELKGIYCKVNKFLSQETMNNDSGEVLRDKIQNISVNIDGFYYPNSKEAILSNTKFYVDKPSVISITGKSGSGKSTLLKMMMNLLPLKDDEVKLNGYNILKYSRNSIWDKVGYLDQNPHLLKGSILYNITLNSNANVDDDVVQAIEDAGLSDYIKKLPDGLNTIIDTQKVSNGELQKLCFARVFYAKYDILLLDEATACLDPGAEKYIMESLHNKVRTDEIFVFNVTHDKDVIENSDYIIFINDLGDLKGFDSHENLLSSCEDYKNMLCEF